MYLYEQMPRYAGDAGWKHMLKVAAAMCVLFLNYFMGNDYLALISTGYICLELVICQKKDVIPTLLFVTSFSQLFHFNQYDTFEFVCLAGIARMLFQDAELFKEFYFVQPVYLITHFWSTKLSDINLGRLIPIVALMCFFYASYVYHKEERESCINFYIAGHLLSGFLGYFREMTRLRFMLETDHTGGTIRFAGLAFDCNFFALPCVLILCYMFFEADGMKPWIWIMVTGATMIMGAQTYSKSFYLCAAVVIWIAVINRNPNMKRKLLLLFVVCMVACIAFGEEIGRVFDVFFQRFTGAETVDDLTTGRAAVWKLYFEQQFSSIKTFFFGNGLVVRQKAAHNLFLQLLSQFGVIGALIDFLYFKICYSRIVKNKKLVMSDVCTILIVGMLLFNLSAYTFSGLWSCLFIMLLIISDKKDERYAVGKHPSTI